MKDASLRVDVVDDVEGFDRLRDEWQDLHVRTVPRNVFTSYAWSRTWWRYFGESREPFIVTVREGERLVALAPLELSRMAAGPSSARVLQIIATAAVPSRGMGLSDRADFLVEPTRADALGRIASSIAEDQTWDVLLLRGIPEDSPALGAMESALEGGRILAKRRRRSSSLVLELPPSWDAFVGSKSSKWRKTYRSQLNRAERAGQVSYERHFPCSPEKLAQLWDQVVAIHMTSWKAERGTGLLQLGALRDFFRDLAVALAAEGLLDLSVARIDGKPFAYEMYLSTSDTVGAYDGAYDQQWAHLSPGILLTGFLIRDSIERGMAVFDFMRDLEPYKRRWGGRERHEVQLAAYRRQRPAAIGAMSRIEGKEFLRRFSWLEELADRATGAWVRWKTRRASRE